MDNSLPPADELVLVDRELAQLDARRAQLLARRAWLIQVLYRPVAAAAPLPPRPPVADSTPRSAQNVLLTLGGTLLTIAAVAFTLVSWGSMGIGARAAVLAVVTGAALAAPVALLRKGLVSTAESVAALGLVLMVLDAYALHRVALPGAGGLGYTAVASAVLAGAWTAYGSALSRLRIPRPVAVVAAQLPLPLGVLAAGGGSTAFAWAALLTATADAAVALWTRPAAVRVTAGTTGAALGGWALLTGGGLSCSLLERRSLLLAGATVILYVARRTLLRDGGLRPRGPGAPRRRRRPAAHGAPRRLDGARVRPVRPDPGLAVAPPVGKRYGACHGRPTGTPARLARRHPSPACRTARVRPGDLGRRRWDRPGGRGRRRLGIGYGGSGQRRLGTGHGSPGQRRLRTGHGGSGQRRLRIGHGSPGQRRLRIGRGSPGHRRGIGHGGCGRQRLGIGHGSPGRRRAAAARDPARARGRGCRVAALGVVWALPPVMAGLLGPVARTTGVWSGEHTAPALASYPATAVLVLAAAVAALAALPGSGPGAGARPGLGAAHGPARLPRPAVRGDARPPAAHDGGGPVARGPTGPADARPAGGRGSGRRSGSGSGRRCLRHGAEERLGRVSGLRGGGPRLPAVGGPAGPGPCGRPAPARVSAPAPGVVLGWVAYVGALASAVSAVGLALDVRGPRSPCWARCSRC
ncbi:hypothetical protein O1L60_06855 [Streptomyces diastatochromogenes]|nr:hypothetical protein [Streptomyces diastatochromogenes]